MISDEMIERAQKAIRYLHHAETPWSKEQVSAVLEAALECAPSGTGPASSDGSECRCDSRAALPPDVDVAGIVDELHRLVKAGWAPIRMRKDGALVYTLSEAASALTRLSAELAEVRAERDEVRKRIEQITDPSYLEQKLTDIGICDVEWRARATAAEAELAETKSLLAEARTEIAQMMHQGPEAERDRLREALLKIEKEAHYGAYASDHIACHNCADLEKIARAALGEKADG